MQHGTLQTMIDEMLEDPDELFISSNSKHCALISLRNGSTFLIEGDFSGTPEQCEEEARHILSSMSNRRSRPKETSW